MGIVTASEFRFYREKIFSLGLPITKEVILTEQFLLEKDEHKQLEIYYTPFDYLNEEASVVLVGITPGLHQMKKAYQAVVESWSIGLEDEEILLEVKKKASFEGTMRRNLVTMLDDLGLAEHLGLTSTLELFGSASHLVYTTSILPHAVFFRQQNYNGSRPPILKTERLFHYVNQYFLQDILRIRDPLIIPLGVNVNRVIEYLINQNLLNIKNVIAGFPHPSGGNGHRQKQFRKNKEEMKKKIWEYFNK